MAIFMAVILSLMSDQQRTITVIPGQIWVYRHTQSKNWMCRIKRPNHQKGGDYFRKSTGKADLDEAKQQALHYYQLLYSGVEGVESQLKPGAKKVKHVIDELIRRNEEGKFRLTQNDKSILERHIKPDIGETPIKKLKFIHYDEYLRQSKISTASAIENHISALNKLTRFCVLKEYIASPEAFSITKKEYTKDKESREVAAFTDQDWRNILDKFDGFIFQEGLKRTTKDRRQLLRIYMQFLMETGIRPGAEIDGISVNDISMEERDGRLVCSVHIRSGKVSKKHQREIPLNSKAIEALQNALTFQIGEDGFDQNTILDDEKRRTGDFNPLPNNPELKRLSKARGGPNKNGDWVEYIALLKDYGFGDLYPFCVNNKRIDWSQVFNQFRDHLGNTLNPNRYYKLYSCRHSYITRELKAGRDIYRLSKYCGTSVQMIEKFYSKMVSMGELDEISQNNPEIVDTASKYDLDPSKYIDEARELEKLYTPLED